MSLGDVGAEFKKQLGRFIEDGGPIGEWRRAGEQLIDDPIGVAQEVVFVWIFHKASGGDLRLPSLNRPPAQPPQPPKQVTTPNAQMRANANLRPTINDPLTNQPVPVTTRLAADHVVPKDWIKQVPGFDKLTPAQQSWLLNHPLNTQGLPGTFNSSKGAKMPGDWTTYKGQPLDPAYVQNDAARGEFLRAWITEMVKVLGAGK